MSPKNEIQQFLDQTIAPLLAELREEFRSSVIEHQREMRAEDMRRPNYDDRSALTPYLTRHANGYFYPYWSKYSGWRIANGRRVRNTKHIKTVKKSGHYAEKELTKCAMDWEIKRVMETERKFQVLRKRQTALGEARLALTELLALLT